MKLFPNRQMMLPLRLLIVLFLCSSFILPALSSEINQNVIPKKQLVISYFDTPFQNMQKAIIAEAYKLAGIDVKFVKTPGKRSLRLSSSGEVDAELNRIGKIDKHYPTLIKVPTPMYPLTGVSLTNKHDIKVESWADLNTHRIGVIRGVPFYEKPTKGMDKIEVSTYLQLFKMMERDRIDIVIGTEFSCRLTLKKYFPLSNNIIIGKVLLKVDTYHYLHEKNKDIVPLIDIQLKKMQKSGRILEIVEEQIIEQANN